VKPPKCRLCGHVHSGVDHVFASNTASNKVTASNNASNGSRVGGGGVDGATSRKDARDAVGVRQGEPGPRGDGEGARKQRWSRESYNAYQREYMRKRRNKKEK